MPLDVDLRQLFALFAVSTSGHKIQKRFIGSLPPILIFFIKVILGVSAAALYRASLAGKD